MDFILTEITRDSEKWFKFLAISDVAQTFPICHDWKITKSGLFLSHKN